MAFAGRAFLLTAGRLRRTDGLLPDCVARFTLGGLDARVFLRVRY